MCPCRHIAQASSVDEAATDGKDRLPYVAVADARSATPFKKS